MRALLLIVLLLCSSALAQPENEGEDMALFRSAVVSIGQGDDQRALDLLNKVKTESFGAHYNRGLVYRNLGDIPRSRAAFEQALQLAPRSLTTRRRLRELRGRMDSDDLLLDTRWTPWWSRREAEVLIFLPLLLLLGAAAMRLAGRAPKGKLLVGLGLSGLLLGAFFWLTNPPALRAVIIDPSARLLPVPESGKQGSQLPAGIMVEVVGEQDHYAEIRLGDERSGWVRRAKLAPL